MFASLNSLSLPTPSLALLAWAVATAKASASDIGCWALIFAALRHKSSSSTERRVKPRLLSVR